MTAGIIRPKTHKTDEQKKEMKAAAQKLIEHLGGLTVAAGKLGVKRLVLNGWRTRGQIPVYQAKLIEAMPGMKEAGFTVDFMRPDVEV